MAEIGTMSAALLIKVGDGEPFEVGTLSLDISGHVSLRGGYATVEVDSAALRHSLADALEDGAKQLRERE